MTNQLIIKNFLLKIFYQKIIKNVEMQNIKHLS